LRRRPGHELPLTPFDLAPARRRLRGPRNGPDRLSRSDRAEISLLQLWRRDAHSLTTVGVSRYAGELVRPWRRAFVSAKEPASGSVGSSESRAAAKRWRWG